MSCLDRFTCNVGRHSKGVSLEKISGARDLEDRLEAHALVTDRRASAAARLALAAGPIRRDLLRRPHPAAVRSCRPRDRCPLGGRRSGRPRSPARPWRHPRSAAAHRRAVPGSRWRSGPPARRPRGAVSGSRDRRLGSQESRLVLPLVRHCHSTMIFRQSIQSYSRVLNSSANRRCLKERLGADAH